MQNYDFALSYRHSHAPRLADRTVAPMRLYEANRLIELTATEAPEIIAWLEKNLGTVIIAVMRDGIAIGRFHANARLKAKDRKWTYTSTYHDWADIRAIQLEEGRLELELATPEGSDRIYARYSEHEIERFYERFTVHQNHGEIPRTVTLLPRAPKPKEAEKKTRNKGDWVFFLVLLAIIVGVPFFQGGGSLAAAALPGLAEIAPDAVNLAIRNNSQWSFGTKARLIGISSAMYATPTVALTGFFGLQQNNAYSLWFVPLYWVETFASRDWQVRTLASMIADSENKPAAQN